MKTTSPRSLSSTKRALLALKRMQTRLNSVEGALTEPIAIISMGCRFPGGADNPDEFWKLLSNGTDTITEVPPDRWNIDAFYDPDPDKPGKMYSRHGAFLSQVDAFDPLFFGITPNETIMMDPNQRLLLEVCWEAIENASLLPESLKQTKTGVFIGVMRNRSYINDPITYDSHTATGNGLSVVAGRLSYFFGLQGPAITLDTACSSSLVTLHLACQSLRMRESDLAVAGGVNVILSPDDSIAISHAQMLSPDGRCKSFDASANGYVRGEGCGVVILKRLSDALSDEDNVLAVIRGSATNHNGRSSGLTVPNELAQEAVITAAMKNARVNPSEIYYIETHGSATSLGDPIEASALGSIFGKNRSKEEPLIIGSVKTNLGHLEGAAGIAGFIKTILALQHQEIPPHLHFQHPNPHVLWDELPIKVATERIPWQSMNEKKIAGISSFGYSGTNAHFVVEEFRNQTSMEETQHTDSDIELLNVKPIAATPSPLHILTLSAKTENALKELAGRYDHYLLKKPDIAIEDICFTSNTCRTNFPHRLCVIAESSIQIQEKLALFASNKTVSKGVLNGKATANKSKPVFLFTGQGAQYVGMGRELYETQSVFRKMIDQCDKILQSHMDKPLLEILYPKNIDLTPKDKSLFEMMNPKNDDQKTGPLYFINDTIYSQPATFAVEYALAELWKSWGIQPEIVLGHSLGEYIAACVAGVFSLEDGLKLVANRARLMKELSPEGEMLTAFAPENKVTEAIQPYMKDVSVAAVNGPGIILFSGRKEAVRKIAESLETERIRTIKVNISHAFHSPLTEYMLAEYEKVLSQVKLTSPKIKLISNLTGEFVTDEIASPQYWLNHLRQPVKFADSMKMLHEKNHEIFVEIGPDPVLLGLDQCLPEGYGASIETPIQWLPSLRPKYSDLQQMLESLGALFVSGASINWQKFYNTSHYQKVILPNYPFQRERYWIQSDDQTQKTETRAEESKLNYQEPECLNLKSETIRQNIKTISQKTSPNNQRLTATDSIHRIMSEQIRTMTHLMDQQLEMLNKVR
ncbi:MAG: type I polyketide synthase [Candidatus Magnetomorum sp.]|nr:type I polyketide synthase [Candidatus Magnetomorum sp.]